MGRARQGVGCHWCWGGGRGGRRGGQGARDRGQWDPRTCTLHTPLCPPQAHTCCCGAPRAQPAFIARTMQPLNRTPRLSQGTSTARMVLAGHLCTTQLSMGARRLLPCCLWQRTGFAGGALGGCQAVYGYTTAHRGYVRRHVDDQAVVVGTCETAGSYHGLRLGRETLYSTARNIPNSIFTGSPFFFLSYFLFNPPPLCSTSTGEFPMTHP